MDRIRIILVALPRLPGDIVRAVDDGNIRVVGEQNLCDDLVAAVDNLAANAVLVGSRLEELPAGCRALLERRPAVKVVVIRSDARVATLYELRRLRERFDDLSAEQIVGKVRVALEASTTAW